MVEVTSEHPKLIFDPIASKIMIDEKKSFNSIDLIEIERKSCFSEGLYFRGGGVGFSSVLFIEFLDLFIELFDFFP